MNTQASTVQQPTPILPTLPKVSEIAMEFWEELLRGVVTGNGQRVYYVYMQQKRRIVGVLPQNLQATVFELFRLVPIAKGLRVS